MRNLSGGYYVTGDISPRRYDIVSRRYVSGGGGGVSD